MRWINMNEFRLIGNLGKDPVVHEKTNSIGFSLAYSYAYNANYKNPAGAPEWKEHTNWFYVTYNNQKLYNDVLSSIKKGDKVLVTGQLASSSNPEGKTTVYLNAKTIELVKTAGASAYNQDKYDSQSPEQDRHFHEIMSEIKAVANTSLDDIPF